MFLKCIACGRSDELSPLRIGRPHATCPHGAKGIWVQSNSSAPAKKKPRKK